MPVPCIPRITTSTTRHWCQDHPSGSAWSNRSFPAHGPESSDSPAAWLVGQQPAELAVTFRGETDHPAFRHPAGPAQFLDSVPDRGPQSAREVRSAHRPVLADGRPAPRLDRGQAREIERHRLCERRRDCGDWGRPNEPGRLRADRCPEIRRCCGGGGIVGASGQRVCGCLRCLLPLCGRSSAGGGGRGDGGDSTRRFHA